MGGRAVGYVILGGNFPDDELLLLMNVVWRLAGGPTSAKSDGAPKKVSCGSRPMPMPAHRIFLSQSLYMMKLKAGKVGYEAE